MTGVYSSLTLPSDYDEMNEFIIRNKVLLTEKVVSAVQYALNHNLSSIEVFNFKNSDFIVMLEYDSFRENINNIYEFYIQSELYELCERVSKLKNSLETHEKKQKRYKSKSTTKRKT